jgi:hypothetical protein
MPGKGGRNHRPPARGMGRGVTASGWGSPEASRPAGEDKPCGGPRAHPGVGTAASEVDAMVLQAATRASPRQPCRRWRGRPPGSGGGGPRRWRACPRGSSACRRCGALPVAGKVGEGGCGVLPATWKVGRRGREGWGGGKLGQRARALPAAAKLGR